jgi:voltage-gated potassium channel
MPPAAERSSATSVPSGPWQLFRSAFHRPQTEIYRWVQGIVWALIGVSVALFAVDFAYSEGGDTESGLAQFPLLFMLDRAILAFFAVEIALRIASYRPPRLDFFDLTPSQRLTEHVVGRLRYCLQPLVLVDLLTVVALIPGLRGLRALRLLRLARTSKVFRYSNPFQGLARAFADNALLFAFALTVFGLTVFLGGLSFYLTELTVNEGITLGDGLWWSVVTVTTVGFGDITPQTPAGKLVAAALMIAGMFNLALFAGIVGHTILHAVLTIREEQFRMTNYIDHVVVCGYSGGARMLLDALAEEIDFERHPVVLFAEGERPKDVPPDVLWVDGDPTKESELGKVRLSHASTVIIVGSRAVPPQQADATTILTLFTIRAFMKEREERRKAERKSPLYLVAEILDAENVDHARAAGADEVIETTRLGFSLLSHAVAVPGTAAIMSRVAAAGAHSVFVAPPPSRWQLPLPFAEAARRMKGETGALLLGIRTGESDHLNPGDGVEVRAGCRLIYLAEAPGLDVRPTQALSAPHTGPEPPPPMASP